VPVVRDGAIGDAEACALFDDLAAEPALVLAVSGGPDSTALLHLMARWRATLRPAPHLVAVTVDHGLRPEAKREAAAVKQMSENLGVEHVTMRWTGDKPSTGIQEAARQARYGLLRTAARRAGARCVVTAHTLDDQAETVLFRMARGSGLAGLCGMARKVAIDNLAGGAGRSDVVLARPLLDVPKARLIVTLREAGISYAEDSSNADPRFTRARLRQLMPALAEEGLTSRCLVRLARRVRRSEAAHEATVDRAAARLGLSADSQKVVVDGADWRALPDEIALRLLGRAIGAIGTEGPVEFGKLEALHEALNAALAGGATRFRRTLAGAMVSLQRHGIAIDRAPARRGRSHLGERIGKQIDERIAGGTRRKRSSAGSETGSSGTETGS
jgi:tRNA(Ile)-lysidine synthase